MFSDLIINPVFYYLTFGLQLFCAIHCLWKRRPLYWLLVLFFVPILGSIIYLFTEIIDKSNIGDVKAGLPNIVIPAARIKKLEKQLKFSDTFSNRIQLADAYLAAGQTEKAIELYEKSLTGAFSEGEHAQMQLMKAYFEMGRYEDVVARGRKVYKLPQFARSPAHLLYALALEKTGNLDQADLEFKAMKTRFSHYELRYEYGCFLARNHRNAEAKEIFNGILDEASHLDSQQRSRQRTWFSKSKDALKKMETLV